jgi:hypothetical protein
MLQKHSAGTMATHRCASRCAVLDCDNFFMCSASDASTMSEALVVEKLGVWGFVCLFAWKGGGCA